MDVNDQLNTPAALLPRKEPPISTGRRLGGSQSRSGRGGKIGTVKKLQTCKDTEMSLKLGREKRQNKTNKSSSQIIVFSS
jgi:hypothetical protein